MGARLGVLYGLPSMGIVAVNTHWNGSQTAKTGTLNAGWSGRTMKIQTLLVLLCLVSALGVLGACGDSDEGSGDAANNTANNTANNGTPDGQPEGFDVVISANVVEGDAPLTVQFSSEVVGGTVRLFSWNFGDGGSAVESDPEHTFEVDGSYIVTLLAIDEVSGETATDSLSITVGNAAPPGGRTWEGSYTGDGSDLRGYSSVTGDLTIQSEDITTLDDLSALTNVGGLIRISQNDALTNIDGLSSLTRVGGFLEIVFNPLITNVDGLSSLTRANDININSNDALTNVDGLSGITSVNGFVNISNNPLLENINGLAGLRRTGENLFINDNDILEDIDALSSLTSIGRNLSVTDNPALTNVDGLSSLTLVEDTVFINDNRQMCQESVDNLVERLNMSADPPTIDDITGNDGPCP